MSLASTLKALRYKTPPGKVDIPYAYVFDASVLTDGQVYNYLQQYIDSDSEFILRNISGMSLVAASFRPYYQSRMLMFQSLVKSVANWPVMPEALYPRGGQILFDLGVVTRAFNSSGGEPHIYTSNIAFQGVRRYNASEFPVYKTPYDYRELPRHYTFDLVPGSHWTDAGSGLATPSKTFNIPLLDGDFELLSIGVVDHATNAAPTANVFTLRLYDAQGWYRFSDIGFNLNYWNAIGPQVIAAPAVNAYYRPSYPTPSTVYPEAGGIKFEITSLLPFALRNNAYQLNFYGIQRQRNGAARP